MGDLKKSIYLLSIYVIVMGVIKSQKVMKFEILIAGEKSYFFACCRAIKLLNYPTQDIFGVINFIKIE